MIKELLSFSSHCAPLTGHIMSVLSRNIRDEIRRYVPGIKSDISDHGFERLNILLLGFTGHGKSSLINSCMCVVSDGEYKNEAGAGKYDGGLTEKRRAYQLTDTIWISDNRGFAALKPEEILEVCAQLRHLRHEGDVKWEKDNLQKTLRCIPKSYKQPKEFILPVIVHSCLYDFKDVEESMKRLINKCQEITEMPPVVVITNLGPTNNRSGDGAAMEKRFGEMGCTDRICLENYTENNQTKSPEADNQFLDFLDICMTKAEHAIQKRGRQDPHKIFAEHVANQVKEEKEVENRKLEEERNKERKKLEEEVRDLKERFRKKEEEKKCILI